MNIFVSFRKMAFYSALCMLLMSCQTIKWPPPAHLVPTVVSPQIGGEENETLLANACKDYSNFRGAPEGVPYYWRFHLAFNSSNVIGCISMRKPGSQRINWQHTIPCEVTNQSQNKNTLSPLVQAQKLITAEIPALPAAGVTDTFQMLTYTVVPSGQFITCSLNLNELIALPDASLSMGITSTSPVYTYTYFSMSALTFLSTTEAYLGTIIALEPQCTTEEKQIYESACTPSTWDAIMPDEPSNVRFSTDFNGETLFKTPGSFPFNTTYIQGWWVGMRPQFDTLVNTDTLKLEHMQDQPEPITKSVFRHQAITYGRKYPLTQSNQHFNFWGGPVKIYIGGGPDAGNTTFNGAILQIMIDPSGGGAPDGGI